MTKLVPLAAFLVLSQSACSPAADAPTGELADSASLRHTVFDASFGMLSEVVGWAPVNDSILVLADRDRLHLLHVPSGSVVGGAGNEGDGPGEFRRIEWVVPFGQGGVAVYDSNLGRLTHFDSTLGVRATRSLQNVDGHPQCMLPDGAIVTTRVVDYRGNTGRQEGRYQPLLALEAVDDTGRRFLAHVQHAPQRVFVRTAGFSRSIMLIASPFSPVLTIRCTDSDVMWTDSAGSSIWRSAGTSMVALQLEGIEPRPIPSSAYAMAADSAERAAGRDVRMMLEAAADADRRSATPGLATFVPSPGETLWVLAYTRDERGRKVWSEHRSDGSLVRRVAVPAEFELGAVVPGYLVGHVVRHDETLQVRVYAYH